MKYAHIIHYFNSSPWAILPEKLQAILSIIELRVQGLALSQAEIEAKIGSKERGGTVAPTSIAVLPIFGTISHRASMLKQASGGMSVESFTQDFRAAVRNPEVGAIVLDVDSPGGSTDGIEELASEIHAARGQKRIVASVNTMAASAAYWLATSAHEIAVTPSGHVGSIGVMGLHVDASEKVKADGLRVSIVSAGKFKAEGNAFAPLSEDAREHMQALVDDRYDAFVAAVARGRGVAQKTVREGFGEGRVVTAKEAMKQGMVDSIETLDQVVSRLAGKAARARAQTTATAPADNEKVFLELLELG